jgi:hypothetical protein
MRQSYRGGDEKSSLERSCQPQRDTWRMAHSTWHLRGLALSQCGFALFPSPGLLPVFTPHPHRCNERVCPIPSIPQSHVSQYRWIHAALHRAKVRIIECLLARIVEIADWVEIHFPQHEAISLDLAICSRYAPYRRTTGSHGMPSYRDRVRSDEGLRWFYFEHCMMQLVTSAA